MRVDIMTDIETLGTKSDSTIFQISAISFDIETGEYISQFNQTADITENTQMNVDGSTLVWWLNTNKELLTDLLNNGESSSEHLLLNFNDWLIQLSLKYELHLWGNGILFDNKMIQHQFENIGLMYPIHYRNDRDLRTMIDLASRKLGMTDKELKENFRDDSLIAHNALDDVKYQINLVVNCYRTLIEGA